MIVETSPRAALSGHRHHQSGPAVAPVELVAGLAANERVSRHIAVDRATDQRTLALYLHEMHCGPHGPGRERDVFSLELTGDERPLCDRNSLAKEDGMTKSKTRNL